jgi:hypothetical protein
VTDVENARREWEDGYRRFVASSGDASEALPLYVQLEVVTEELRKRVGQTFTLGELAQAYGGADAWTRATLEERAETPGWPRTVSVVGDAAFHLYSRGAADYTP